MVFSHQNKTPDKEQGTYAFLWCLLHQIRQQEDKHGPTIPAIPYLQDISCHCLVVVLLYCENTIRLFPNFQWLIIYNSPTNKSACIGSQTYISIQHSYIQMVPSKNDLPFCSMCLCMTVPIWSPVYTGKTDALFPPRFPYQSPIYPAWGWLTNLWKGWAMRGNHA